MPHDPWQYQDVIVEDERSADGLVARTATVFLTGRECPWRCVMCDLWRHTLEANTPPGAIAAQVAAGRARCAREERPVTRLKLYNAGSFFDPRAVPEADYGDIAAAVAGLAEVVVESHPALIGPRVDRLLDALHTHRAPAGRPPQLEVAMGLETAHPAALERLHKLMSVEQFAGAAATLGSRGVSLRTFLLIGPPFVPPDEQDGWLLRSIEVARRCGASVVTLIPTRDGNGAMEALSAVGSFRPPHLTDIERSVDAAHAARHHERIFVDLWDLERFSDCDGCFAARRARLHAMNLEQVVLPPVVCGAHHAARRPDRGLSL